MADLPPVLVTRPAGQGASLCAALREAGYPAHHLPLLALEPLPALSPSQRRLVQDLGGFGHVIFISGNAVRFGLERIHDCWPQLPTGLHWYAVGAATARLLAQYGVDPVEPGGEMTSEALLALPQLRDVAGAHILIVKGEGGRGTLRESLTARGAQVAELVCYRRLRPTYRPGELAAHLREWAIGVVMISSGEGLEHLLALLSPEESIRFSPITLLVPSERVAAMARRSGWERIIVAENASDGAMLDALQAGFRNAESGA